MRFLSVAMDLAYLRSIGVRGCTALAASMSRRAATGAGHARPPGNFFLSIPMATPQVLAAGKKVQSVLHDHDSRLARACTDPAAAHITLWTVSLTSAEEEEAAVTILEELRHGLPSAARPAVVELDSVQHFRQHVLFFSVAPGQNRDSLFELASELRSAFASRGMFDDSDQDEFHPHVTVANFGKVAKSMKKEMKRFPGEVCAAVERIHAGKHGPVCLRLCRIKDRQPGEYYELRHEIQL